MTQISGTDPTPGGELLGGFLLPPGFARPGLAALWRERRVVGETGRLARSAVLPRRRRRRDGEDDLAPVLLVPGFLAGDASLVALGAGLRSEGMRTHRAGIHANIGCTAAAAEHLEERLEELVAREGRRVQVVGHSLGGMLARGLAVRRPDLVAGLVTLGSPMLAPGAHHLLLTASLEVLVRLNRAGLYSVMARDCVGGGCARTSFDETRAPVPLDVGFTALYSRRDGIVDWRACLDRQARVVEVTSSHVGMAVDPRVRVEVARALRRHHAESDAVVTRARPSAVSVASGSAVEVDRGESA